MAKLDCIWQLKQENKAIYQCIAYVNKHKGVSE